MFGSFQGNYLETTELCSVVPCETIWKLLPWFSTFPGNYLETTEPFSVVFKETICKLLNHVQYLQVKYLETFKMHVIITTIIVNNVFVIYLYIII